jgi:hypothetical protein
VFHQVDACQAESLGTWRLVEVVQRVNQAQPEQRLDLSGIPGQQERVNPVDVLACHLGDVEDITRR